MKHYLRYAFFFTLLTVFSLTYIQAQFETSTVAEDTERCDITAVTAGIQACGPAVDHYTQEIIVDYEYPPEGGQLLVEINGNSRFIAYPVTGSPQSIWLENLPANGSSVSIFVKFSNDNGCTWNARNLFRAPMDCSTPMAWVQLIHNAPDPALSPVDIYLTEDFGIFPQSRFFDNVEFKTATPCLPVEPGDYNLGFARANSNGPEEVLREFPFSFVAGEKYILMASGVGTPANFPHPGNPEDISFDVKSFTPGQVRSGMADEVDILAFQGVPDRRRFDVVADGMAPSFVNNIIYGRFKDYKSLSAGPHKLDVTSAGNITTFGSFYADLSRLGGRAGVMFLSGFVTPANTAIAPELGLCMALPNGHVIDFPPYIECEISSVEAGDYLGCDPRDETYDQEIVVTYDTDPMEAGDLKIELNGSGDYITVAATGSPQTIVLENLPIDGRGDYVDVKVKFSNATPPCYYRARDLFRAPRHCRCDITAVRAGRQSDCDFRTQKYDQQIIVEYINEPSTGYIQVEINGGGGFLNFPITGSPQTIPLTGLEGDGEYVDIFVRFSDTDHCTWTARDLYRAPNCRPCDITSITAGRQLNCDEDTDRYDQEIIIEYTDAPTTGKLLVYISGRGPLEYDITGSPQTIVVEGIPVGGVSYDVGANFSDKDCPARENDVFRSPDGCRCDIEDIVAGDQTECDPRDNTYDQDITIYYSNPPADGHLLVELNDNDNYLEFDITGSPQTITLEGLESDGEYVDVEVKFSRDRDCRRSERDVFRAPEHCRPEIVSYTLIDAEADTAIAAYDPIPDGAVINLYFMPTDQLNIRANTDPDMVGSVKFHLEGDFDFNRLEEENPYALFGDINADYFLPPQAFEAGQSFTLDGRPYSMSDANGVAGDEVRISFSFIHNIPPVAVVESASDTLAYPNDSIKICGYGMDMDGFIASLDWSQVSGPSTATLDTCLRVDTTIISDTTLTPDTNVTMNTVITSDTTITNDTIRDMNGADSVITMDTMIVMDTMVVNDTVIGTDTSITMTSVFDTLVCLKASDLDEGTYTFRLCATDDGGLSDCEDVKVFVEGPPGPTDPSIESFTLIDADTDTAIAAFDPIPDGVEIPIADLPTDNLSIRANAVDGTNQMVSQVKMKLEGSLSVNRTESVAPYAMFGDIGGNYNGRTDLAVDGNSYTVSATAYGGGSAGGSLSVDFSFVSGNRLGLQRGVVEIYPNPSNGHFRVLATPAGNSKQAGQARMYVTNGLGQVIFTETLDENVAKDINLGSVSEGLYIIRIEGDGYIATDKILIKE